MDTVVLALAKKYTDEKVEQAGGGGISAGFGTPTASATQLESTEQPTVSIEASGPNTAKVFDFKFGIPKGKDGVSAGFGEVTATIDNTIGIPKVEVTTSGPDTSKKINFAFSGLKGENGEGENSKIDKIESSISIGSVVNVFDLLTASKSGFADVNQDLSLYKMTANSNVVTVTKDNINAYYSNGDEVIVAVRGIINTESSAVSMEVNDAIGYGVETISIEGQSFEFVKRSTISDSSQRGIARIKFSGLNVGDVVSIYNAGYYVVKNEINKELMEKALVSDGTLKFNTETSVVQNVYVSIASILSPYAKSDDVGNRISDLSKQVIESNAELTKKVEDVEEGLAGKIDVVQSADKANYILSISENGKVLAKENIAEKSVRLGTADNKFDIDKSVKISSMVTYEQGVCKVVSKGGGFGFFEDNINSRFNTGDKVIVVARGNLSTSNSGASLEIQDAYGLGAKFYSFEGQGGDFSLYYVYDIKDNQSRAIGRIFVNGANAGDVLTLYNFGYYVVRVSDGADEDSFISSLVDMNMQVYNYTANVVSSVWQVLQTILEGYATKNYVTSEISDSESRVYDKVNDNVIEMLKEKNWYFGKSACAYGDSITEMSGDYTAPDGVQGSAWVTRLQKKYGLDIELKGIGGTTITDLGVNCLSNDVRLDSLPKNKDIYFIEGGINDWLQSQIPEGGFKDGLEKICKYFKTNMPNAIVIWFCPHYCLTKDSNEDLTEVVNSRTLKDFVPVMEQVIRENNMIFVNVYEQCGWGMENYTYFLNDQGSFIHPNRKGGERIASLISEALNKVEPIVI